MPSNEEGPAAIDRLIHDPSRLAICTALLQCESADFVFLRSITGLTAGNLSFHLTRLREAGLVSVTRKLIGSATRTDVSLTPDGRRRVTQYWQVLDRIRRDGGAVAGEEKSGQSS